MQSQSEYPPSAAPGEPQQDPELWFEDGNVVIVAGSAAFRVHTSILSRHSEVFQDTFGVPRPALPAPSDVFDGHPVVHVSDSAHDFKQLLCMLYDGVRFMPPDHPVAFSTIAAVARLGHKRRLRSIFRPSYEEWCQQEGRSSHLVGSVPSSGWIEALNLIRLIGETDMLPVAIYQCCQPPSTVLFKGTRRVDGTVETLDLPTLELCFNVHTKLIQRQAQLNGRIFCLGPFATCQDKQECGATISEFYRGILISPSFLSGHPLNGSIYRLIKSLEVRPMICALCVAALMERDRDGRRAVWGDLPSITGVTVNNWGQA
ncbi:hypothetical protein V8D89_014710 [Ganoderma adspersum]